MIRTSYELHGYGSLLQELTRFFQPKRIVEFGLLDGYSLSHIIAGAPSGVQIEAFDIFDDYQFKHGSQSKLEKQFPGIVKYGDFYCQHKVMEDQSIDFMHIDISNTGDVYRYAFVYYLPKICPGGVMILEGGSSERDQCDWMIKYLGTPIRPVLLESGLEFFTFEAFPSLTMVKASV